MKEAEYFSGADTLVAGLVYTLWELARPQHKAHLDRLSEEVKSIEYKNDGRPVSYAAIDGLVWLECCIREGLRLHTPSGHIQARVVPKGGAIVASYMIPEKVR
jgi:cytochrome P450